MNKERYSNLLRTMYVQTASHDFERMNLFIISELSKIDGVTWSVDDGNIYVTKGEADTYPCSVAHTDTVHNIETNFNIFKLEDKLFSLCGESMRRVGIGGDDKVGVFVTLQIIKEAEITKAAFFRDEEVGCIGSGLADMEFFKDVEFVLQCDRKGYKDFVNEIGGTRLFSTEFSAGVSALLDKYGRKETSGGLTDVAQLVDNGLEVSVANMSCGYYDPHSDTEYIVISEVNDTLDFCLDIYKAMSGVVWTVENSYRNAWSGRGYGGGGYGRGGGRWNSLSSRDYTNQYDDWYDNYPMCGGADTKEKDKDDELFPEACYHCGSVHLTLDDAMNEMWCFDCNEYVYKRADDAYDQLEQMNAPTGDNVVDDEFRKKREDALKRYLAEAVGEDDDGKKKDVNIRHIKNQQEDIKIYTFKPDWNDSVKQKK